MGIQHPLLHSHEGYPARKRPDGSLTGTWTHETREFSGYVAACDCGWHGMKEHPPTEEGEDAAYDEAGRHLRNVLRQEVPRRRRDLSGRLSRLASDIADGVGFDALASNLRRLAQEADELAGYREGDDGE